MNLWIRNQDRTSMIETHQITVVTCGMDKIEHYVSVNGFSYGKYKTKERAVEVLDEIQHAMFNIKGILKLGRFVDIETFKKEELRIKKKFGNDFGIVDNNYSVEKLNDGITIYEMPIE